MSSMLANMPKVKIPISPKVALNLKKYAPDIMVVGGIALVVGSAILACKNSVKAHESLEDANDRLKKINYGEEVANGDESFDEKAARKERMSVYRDLGVDLAKYYGPSIIGGSIGIGLILGSHRIERDRNVALTSAYAGLLANYNSYRDRIRREIGNDKERDIYSGVKTEDIVVNTDTGEDEKIKNAKVFHDDGSGHSGYARIFDEANLNWSKSPGDNLMFIKTQQAFANNKLRAEGFLFLNDVYELLGFPRTSEGQLVGWIWDPDDKIHGDNYVDFGIFDNVYQSPEIRDFINGYEPCIWLDFNVDGVVYDLI